MEKKAKILVPTYQMQTRDFYNLLKIMMGVTGNCDVNGIREIFFDEVTEKEYQKSMKRLEKQKIVSFQGTDFQISQAVKTQIEDILTSNYCLGFQNAHLKKANRTLHFYYANNQFVGVMSDDNKTTMAASPRIDGIIASFEKQIMSTGMSSEFRGESWSVIAKDKFAELITAPTKSCALALMSNVKKRKTYATTVVADKKRVQILRGDDNTPIQQTICETVDAKYYYGVIYREIERLVDTDNNGKRTGSQTKEKTDYEKIISSKGFPKNGVGFLFYAIVQTIKSLPTIIKNKVFKNIKSALLYIPLAILTFLYNMYATCYINDTFFFDRNVVWGNLTPYVMAGQISTPSQVYGFNLNVGTIDTVFLVAPLLLILHFVLQTTVGYAKASKLSFIKEVGVALPGIIFKQFSKSFNKKSIWITYSLVFACSFLIMNPITIFLLGVLFLIISAQGESNGIVQFNMIASCAFDRKKVDSGLKEQPTYKKTSEGIALAGCGFVIYSLVNLLLWQVFHYSFYVRLLVTMLMIAFCVLQLVIKDKKKVQNVATVVFIGMILYFVATQTGIVLADDGGISESGGTVLGLIRNAGFSTILGISIATVGFMIGGAVLVPLVVAGVAAGAGVFLTGLTDTAAGDYVDKSSDQFFNGVDDGDSMTALCAGTTALDLVTSVWSLRGPSKALVNGSVLAYRQMSTAKDVISTIADGAELVQSTAAYVNGDGSLGDVAMNTVGLGFDAYGLKGDYFDISDAKKVIATHGADTISNELSKASETFAELNQNKNSMIENVQNSTQDALNAENVQYYAKKDSIIGDLDRNKWDGSITELEQSSKNNMYNQSLDTLNELHAEQQETIIQTGEDMIKEIKDDVKEKVIDKVIDGASKANDGKDYVETIEKIGEDYIAPTYDKIKKSTGIDKADDEIKNTKDSTTADQSEYEVGLEVDVEVKGEE